MIGAASPAERLEMEYSNPQAWVALLERHRGSAPWALKRICPPLQDFHLAFRGSPSAMRSQIRSAIDDVYVLGRPGRWGLPFLVVGSWAIGSAFR